MSPLIITGIILAVLFLISFVPIGIGAKYEKNAFIIVKVMFFHFSIPVEKFTNKSQKKKKQKEVKKKDENDLEEGINKIDFALSLLGDFRRFVRKNFKLSEFRLDVVFGTGDAASTAVLTGHIWSLSYNLLALIDKMVYVENPVVDIKPLFNEAKLTLSAKGIIETSIAHIIATAIVFAYKFLKYKNITRRKTK